MRSEKNIEYTKKFENKENLRNIKLKLTFDGSKFFGFQIQNNKKTVQDEIEKAIKRLTGENIQIISAGRTDRGVHSLGHIVNFYTESDIKANNFVNGINHFLDEGIRILEAEEVSVDFHSRFDAKMKTYKYILSTEEILPPIYNNYKGHCKYKLDVDKMQIAKDFFVGRKNFKAFMGSRSFETNPIREIKSFEIIEDCNDLIFVIKGQSFIRNQVRIMVGTLVDIGRGIIDPLELKDIIESQDRTRAGQTLSPNGLYLMEILYEKS